MGDFYDDFYDYEPFEDEAEDTYGEHLDELEPEESYEDESAQDASDCDEFTGKDAFILGGAMGWAYEEGLEERQRKRRKRKKTNSDDRSTID